MYSQPYTITYRPALDSHFVPGAMMATTDEKIPVDGSSPDVSNSSGTSLDAEVLSDINEKALLRKLDWKLLPAVSLLYLLSFLDRSNGM